MFLYFLRGARQGLHQGTAKDMQRLHYCVHSMQKFKLALRSHMILQYHKFHITFFCVVQGNMSISVCHGGDPIPKSPFTITVAPPLDLNKVKVQGLNNSKLNLQANYVQNNSRYVDCV